MKLTHISSFINHSFTHLLRTSGYHVPFLITTQHWFLPSFLPFLPWGTAKTLNPACSCLHACLLLCCCTQENPHVSIISWAQSWSQSECTEHPQMCAYLSWHHVHFAYLLRLDCLPLHLFNSSCAVKLLNPSKFNAHMLKKSGSTFLAPSCT
jgi:hypothetical protein